MYWSRFDNIETKAVESEIRIKLRIHSIRTNRVDSTVLDMYVFLLPMTFVQFNALNVQFNALIENEHISIRLYKFLFMLVNLIVLDNIASAPY